MKPVIFFDLDGVLADFVRGVIRLHKSDLKFTDVRWGIEEQLGFGKDRLPEFWSQLGYDFWSGLPVYPDGLCLLRHVEGMVGADQIAFLTSPCDTPGCVDGKRTWVERHFPDYRRRLFVGSAKHLFAGPGKLLVDDHDANVDGFQGAGGLAVQPARPWNRLREGCYPDGMFSVPTVAGLIDDAIRYLR